jgi:RNA polymerase sigma factor (sigma-70 family)
MASDRRLLEQFLNGNSQDAFRQLVERHIRLVYWAVWRDLRDREAAEDATRAAFLLLAKKAREIQRTESLAGWLFGAARLAAKDARKIEARRLTRERRAMQQTTGNVKPDPWAEIEFCLNDALATLGADDRRAVLLRYFEQRTFAEIGEICGTTEEATRKRVNRALGRLKMFFEKSGIVSTVVALDVAFSTHAAQSAPTTLVEACSRMSEPTPRSPVHPQVQQLAGKVLNTMIRMKIKSAAVVVCSAMAVTVFTGLAIKAQAPAKPSAQPIAGNTGVTRPSVNAVDAPILTTSGWRLKELALCYEMYAVDHHEMFPNVDETASFKTALSPYTRGFKLNRLPYPNNVKFITSDAVFDQAETGQPFGVNASLSGKLVPSVHDATWTIVFYEPTPDASGRRFVSYVDGQVNQITASEWNEQWQASQIR